MRGLERNSPCGLTNEKPLFAESQHQVAPNMHHEIERIAAILKALPGCDDRRLSAVVASWQDLPEPVREAVFALLQVNSEPAEEPCDQILPFDTEQIRTPKGG